MMRITVKNIMTTMITIITMVSVFFILSVIPNNIPGDKIKNNIITSINTIEKDNQKPIFFNVPIFKLDCFTDALMLNIACNVNPNTPVKSAMENTYYINDKYIIPATKNILNGNYKDVYPINYTRYWHGYQLFLRPLLVITDYSHIRIINFICLSLIFIYLCILILKNHGGRLFTVFLISAILFNLWIVPLSMQYSTVFYISLSASAILLLCLEKYGNEYKHVTLFFLITGGITSYFDLLTTPLLTLGLPLIFYTSASGNNIKEKYHKIFSCPAMWLLGYSVIWISKWIIAHFIIGYDIDDAISSVIARTSTEYKNFDMSFYGIFKFLANYPILLAAAVSSAVIFIFLNIFLYHKKKKEFIENSYLLLIAAMPFIWCITLRNHSVIHYWFVWRIFLISMISYLLFITELYSYQLTKLWMATRRRLQFQKAAFRHARHGFSPPER